MVEVYAIGRVPLDVFERYKEPLFTLLPEESISSLKRFRQPDDFQRSLLGESLTRNLLSSRTGIRPEILPIERSEKGKPFLSGDHEVYFNISHSGDWIVAGISDKEVGIDVERIREPDYRIAERFFSPLELKQLNELAGEERKNYFFDLWTLKESYLKLLGKGLTQSLGSFTMTRTDSQFKIILNGKMDNTIHFFQIQLDPGYKLSVCCQSPEFTPRVIRIDIGDLAKKIEYGN